MVYQPTKLEEEELAKMRQPVEPSKVKVPIAIAVPLASASATVIGTRNEQMGPALSQTTETKAENQQAENKVPEEDAFTL